MDSNLFSKPKVTTRRFTPEPRRAILERYHASGVTQPEFIAGEGISKPDTFYPPLNVNSEE
jgi:hypothetical protein